MFTGIIEELGTIQELAPERGRLVIKARTVLEGTKIGDSIAVDGVCLTVVKLGADFFIADLSEETVTRTHLEERRPGDKVNLERALRLADRLGGHIVSGHIDGVGALASIKKEAAYTLLRFTFPDRYARYVAEKGSVAVNGVSLTVASCEGQAFTVALIPHTLSQTNLQDLHTGEKVNLEFDLLAKYVEKLLAAAGESPDNGSEQAQNSGAITLEFLREKGF